MVVKKEKVCDVKNDTCKCSSDCACGNKTKLLIKSGVILASAILISGAILTAGLDGGCNRSKMHMGKDESRPMPAKMMEKRNEAFREFIMNNPKTLIDSVEKFYAAQRGAQGGQGAEEGCGGGEAPAAAQAPAQAPEMKVAPADLVAKIVADKSNHVLGNPKGKFVIIEFFDYQCGWCKKTNKEMSLAVQSTNNIRWVLIDTPIFGEASETISRYAMAAGKQGKFKEMHEAITNATGNLNETALKALGTSLKLNVKKLESDANSDEIKGKLASNQEIARSLNVNGVPMLIVDGKINPGALIGPRLQEAVKAANAKK